MQPGLKIGAQITADAPRNSVEIICWELPKLESQSAFNTVLLLYKKMFFSSKYS